MLFMLLKHRRCCRHIYTVIPGTSSSKEALPTRNTQSWNELQFHISNSFPLLPTVVSGPRHHNHCLSPYREEAQLPEGPVEHCQQTSQTGSGHRAPRGEFTAKFIFLNETKKKMLCGRNCSVFMLGYCCRPAPVPAVGGLVLSWPGRPAVHSVLPAARPCWPAVGPHPAAGGSSQQAARSHHQSSNGKCMCLCVDFLYLFCVLCF